jgi:4-hydroxy-4-methyl-2-oxoglutarate aldolase
VYASGEAVVGPAGRVSVRGIDVPVNVGGFGVVPGDVIVVDDTGAVRIPADRADEILADARSYATGEDALLDALAGGETIKDAYRLKQEVVDRLQGRTEDQ